MKLYNRNIKRSHSYLLNDLALPKCLGIVSIMCLIGLTKNLTALLCSFRNKRIFMILITQLFLEDMIINLGRYFLKEQVSLAKSG